MATMSDLVMPKLGLTMTEGVVSEWHVKPGDRVRAGDILFVVETDKIANEVEAPADGEISEIVVGAGSTVPVGTTLARWTGPSLNFDQEEAAAPQIPQDDDRVTATAPKQPHAVTPRTPGDRIVATPLARRLAVNGKIDLAAISGSGPRGRIKAADVERAIAEARAEPEMQAHPTFGREATTRPATRSQRIAAARMAEAKSTIPHFYLGSEVDVTRLAGLRRELSAGAEKSAYTLTHFLLVACARALIDLPEANTIWSEDGLVEQPGVDIGIATQTEAGLLVPMVRDLAPLPGFAATAERMNAVVKRSREGKARPDDFGGGALTISNLGMFGVSWVVPIINPPQSAILGVGRSRPVLRPDDDGAPVAYEELALFLSADHRVHDGVGAARLLARISDYIANPLQLGFG